MLAEFSVENFLSFKERVTFSMRASKDTEHNDTNVIIVDNGKRYLKTAVIYGANASGKSNLIKAIKFMAEFVCKSHQMQIGTPIGVVPFKLDMGCLDKPSKFDIIFYSDNIRYAYGFSATDKAVIEEYLYYYPNGRQSIVFERTNINDYRFTDDKETQNSLKERNTENKLYLSTAANWNYKKVYGAMEWFNAFARLTGQHSYARILYFKRHEDFYLNLIKPLIKEIDLGIKDIIINQELFNDSNWDNIFKYIDTVHDITNGDGTKSSVKFNMSEESEGTRKFFLLALELVANMNTDIISFVDELNTNLHTLLSRYIINFFNNAKINTNNNTQLIITTHDTNLLDLNLFRRDQIWFTEKNPDTGATDLYSLYDFGVRKDVNIEKGYLLGRYGAIPFIGGNIND